MYQLLINEKYIASNTTFSIFNGIFDEPKFKQPVVWTKKQSQLIYFVHSVYRTKKYPIGKIWSVTIIRL